MVVRNRVCGPTQCGLTASTTRRTKGGRKLDVGMLGASLSRRRPGKAPLGKPALQPYWGKPAVQNDGGSRKRQHHSKPGPRLDPTRLPLTDITGAVLR